MPEKDEKGIQSISPELVGVELQWFCAIYVTQTPILEATGYGMTRN